MKNPIVTIMMWTHGEIKIELYPHLAPNTVNSIIYNILNKAYDGKEFYRVVKDFVIQTGLQNDVYISPETKNAGFITDSPSFTKGIVGMAGRQNKQSGNSFFIMTGDQPSLDADFPVIGKVIEGMDEVDRINNVPCDETLYKNIPFYKPLGRETIKLITVDTFGQTYPEPKLLD